MIRSEDLLGEEIMSALPMALRRCMDEPRWWDDELQGLHVVRALTELALPPSYAGFRRVDNAPSPRWDWDACACAREFPYPQWGQPFGPVLVGPSCEVGPNASIFGPTVIEGRSYVGPSVEIRRCLLLAGAEVSHMSFLGHSVIGRRATLGAFFCSAVRNLRRRTVQVLHDGAACRHRRTKARLRHSRRHRDWCSHHGDAGPSGDGVHHDAARIRGHKELLNNVTATCAKFDESKL